MPAQGRSTAVNVQRSRACTNQSSTRSTLNWPSSRRWPSAQPCLPWEPEGVLYLVRGATRVSHRIFTAAHVRTCPERPESPRCVGQVSVPGTEPTAQRRAAEARRLPLEPAPAACQLCKSFWRNLQPHSGGSEGLSPGTSQTTPGMGYFCLCSICIARRCPGRPGCAWQHLDLGRSCLG